MSDNDWAGLASGGLNDYEKNVSYDPYYYIRGHYGNAIANPNELSFWYPRVRDIGFRTPETKSIQIPLEFFGDLLIHCEGEQPELEKKLTDYIVANWDLVPGKLDINSKLFFRLGGSSGKFRFTENCIVEGPETFAKAIRNTVYEALCFDKPYSVYLTFREFIETPTERSSIYTGLKLNTEFRIFYDFDKKQFLDGFNYWGDYEQMLMYMQDTDKKAYKAAYPQLEDDFHRLLPSLRKECEEKLKDVNLRGRWSVDFMWTGTEFVLIDMAIMSMSYFSDKVKLPDEKSKE